MISMCCYWLLLIWAPAVNTMINSKFEFLFRSILESSIKIQANFFSVKNQDICFHQKERYNIDYVLSFSYCNFNFIFNTIWTQFVDYIQSWNQFFFGNMNFFIWFIISFSHLQWKLLMFMYTSNVSITIWMFLMSYSLL